MGTVLGCFWEAWRASAESWMAAAQGGEARDWLWVIRPSAVRRARGGGLTGIGANAKGKEGLRDTASVDIDLTHGGKGRARTRAVMLTRGGVVEEGKEQTEG